MKRGRGARAARWWFLAVLLALCTASVPRTAAANTEEFSTFDVQRPEEDDESLIDYMLVRQPRTWRDDWERAPLAIRTTQGCLTSGQWIIETELKLRTAMGDRTQFGVELIQDEGALANYSYLDLQFFFRAGPGWLGAAFRPYYDKSRQDFILSYEAGHDTASYKAKLVFSIEDIFNNLWAWRQTRVGDASSPYEKHPYEPGLELALRRERWRARLDGKYLTPSIRHLSINPTLAAQQRQTLWGTLGRTQFELEAMGLEMEALGFNEQARNTDRYELSPTYAGPILPADSVLFASGGRANFRRLWAAEGAIARRITPRLRAELRYRYQERRELYDHTYGGGRFDAIDRLVAADARYAFGAPLALRVGAMFDRITIASAGYAPPDIHPSRNESRLYVGLEARFGNVWVYGIEGVELDPEPYEVSFHHDKGFLGLQARF